MDLQTALSGIPRHLEVCHLIQAFIANERLASYSVYLTPSLSVASPGAVPVALAIAACILALLSLPLILVLVYKQRQNAQSSRRTYY